MKKVIFILLSSFLLSACAADMNNPYYSNPIDQQISDQSTICNNQEKQDELSNNPQRLSRWAECKRSRVMPLAQQNHPEKAKEIEQMHNEMVSGLKDFEAGHGSLADVYAQFDKRKAEIGLPTCAVRYVAADQKTTCVQE